MAMSADDTPTQAPSQAKTTPSSGGTHGDFLRDLFTTNGGHLDEEALRQFQAR